MEPHYIDITCKDGQAIKFEAKPLAQAPLLKGIPGIAVVIKKDFYGWQRLFKVQGSSLADVLLSKEVRNKVGPDNFYHSYHIAFYNCPDIIIRSRIFDLIATKEL